MKTQSSKFFLSLPYVYPVCPLNISHAKMFVTADVCTRFQRLQGKEVYFPVASHYSGNTAQKLSDDFLRIFQTPRTQLEASDQATLQKFLKVYKTPLSILQTFTDPLRLLDYYSQLILWELRSLGVSCDYDHYYTTKSAEFQNFVRAVLSAYEDKKVIISNTQNILALDYENSTWKKSMLKLLSQIQFLQSFHEKTVRSALPNVRSDWGLARTNGYGVRFKKGLIIDPMFDSEMFTLFDLYKKHQVKTSSRGSKKFFTDLLDAVANKKKSHQDPLIRSILEWLPCDLFIAEEHLKNWLIKRFYAESLLLAPTYQTKKYFILGMGMLEGKRISASSGHAILAKDLIEQYGSLKARLIILLSGGHPSKMYNYDKTLPEQAHTILERFSAYFLYLLTISGVFSMQEVAHSRVSKEHTQLLNTYLTEGHHQKAIAFLLIQIPRKYKNLSRREARKILKLYVEYLDILLPGYIATFLAEHTPSAASQKKNK